MNSTIQHKPELAFLELLVILFCLVYMLVPGVEKSIGFTRILVIESIYTFIILYSSPKSVQKSIFFFWGLALFIGAFYGLFKDPIGITTGHEKLKNFLDYYYFYSNMFFPLLLLYRVTTKASNSQMGFILLMAFVLSLLWSTFVMSEVAINPTAARSFGHGQAGIDDTSWIAPFYFVYGMTFLALLFLFFARYGKTGFFKAFSIIFVIYWMYFLINAQFALALITVFIAFIYMGYSLATTNSERRKWLVIGIVFLVVTPLLLSLLIPIMPEVLANRFSDILNFSNTKVLEEDTDAKGRWDVYSGAFLDFLSSPIWGVNTKGQSVDPHGTVLMVLSQLGLLGFIPLCMGWKRMRNLVIKMMGKTGFYYRPFFFLFIIHSLTNPIHASLVSDIMIGFLVPLCIVKFQGRLQIANMF